jgi:selenocysteine lyase/cysteine desulfurase
MSKQTQSTPLYDRIVGLDEKVVEVNGEMVREINLDSAATTPAFVDVADAIAEKLKTYGSIGRGKGTKATGSSVFYEEARDVIKDFVGASNAKYEVIFVNNTTDGINKLASALIAGKDDIVITTRMEHHANILPWRERCKILFADIDNKGRLCIDSIEKLLNDNKGKVKIVAVTAAANVTGYVNDVHAIAKIAHEYGAKIVVDGAQIVAHRAFSMTAPPSNCLGGDDRDIDYFLFSAHKMYSPYGGGALIGLKEELDKHLPMFYGGGMVDSVTVDEVVWYKGEARYEAGSPNFLGIVGMVKAIEILKKVGFDKIEEHEQELLKKLIHEFNEINRLHPSPFKPGPQIKMYGDVKDVSDRVGILAFNAFLKPLSDDLVAEFLAKNGIAARHAKFCAHIYVDDLLVLPDIDDELSEPTPDNCRQGGMARVSFGIFTTEEDIMALVKVFKEFLISDEADLVKIALTDTIDGVRLPYDRG